MGYGGLVEAAVDGVHLSGGGMGLAEREEHGLRMFGTGDMVGILSIQQGRESVAMLETYIGAS